MAEPITRQMATSEGRAGYSDAIVDWRSLRPQSTFPPQSCNFILHDYGFLSNFRVLTFAIRRTTICAPTSVTGHYMT